MLKPPTEQEIWHFVAATHSLDKIDLPFEQIEKTWKKQIQNPFAHGHFKAIMYMIHTLIPSRDFPAKETGLLRTVRDTDTALFWLKRLHREMSEPVARSPILADAGDPNVPTASMIGSYRLVSSFSVTRQAPPPDMIPKLMHNWLLKYAKFHDGVKDKIQNPYGITKETAREMYKLSEDANIFFLTVKPFAYGNTRLGRLVENCFRLAWNLPMRAMTPDSSDHKAFLPKIQQYEEEQLPKLIEEATKVKG